MSEKPTIRSPGAKALASVLFRQRIVAGKPYKRSVPDEDEIPRCVLTKQHRYDRRGCCIDCGDFL